MTTATAVKQREQSATDVRKTSLHKNFQFLQDEIRLYKNGEKFKGSLLDFADVVVKASKVFLNPDQRGKAGLTMEHVPVQIIRPESANGFICYKSLDTGNKVSMSFFDLYNLHQKGYFTILEGKN